MASTVRKITRLFSNLSLRPLEAETSELVNVNELIMEILGSLNGELRPLVKHVLGKVPCVCLRRDRFQQVLVTLIRNAQQAGGEQGEVHISTSAGDRKVTVLVQDAGSGISPERRHSLFQPFQTSKEEGLGIGLYRNRFIEAHGGTIRVDSQVDFGTTMQIELPAAGSVQTILSPETRYWSA